MATPSVTTAYETVIGLEIHAELLTETKVWCGCETVFGKEANSQCCPVCLGLPGSLPVLNKKALELAVKAGLALNCQIAAVTKFDRKNYYYPDLAKAYQISQDDMPLAFGGYVEFEIGDQARRIGINRVHLEEEAGKSLHSGDNIFGSDYTLIDYNRAGIPLIEIVTEPDLRSPEEARLFLERLRAILLYTGVSDCKMQEGSLRCDANISLRPVGSTEFGTKSEIKNLNSFRAVQRALEYETERQRALLEAGEEVVQETRHWNEPRGVTVSMRTKEDADDYRYFADPDLVPITLDAERIEAWRDELPELPQEKKERFQEEYELPSYDAGVLTQSMALADFYEAVVALYDDPKVVSNWVMGEVLRLLNEDGLEVEEASVRPEDLAELLGLIEKGVISNNVGKEVFEETYRSGKRPSEVVKEKGLEQISDESELLAIVDQVIQDNPGPAQDVTAGKDKAIGFLVGQVMKATRGKANPQRANELLRQRLGK